MARDFAKKFYDSKAWERCREGYISYRQSIDGGLCETCHKRFGYIVHHTIWLTPENINDPDIALNHKHLKFDCLICHNQEENGSQLPKVYFDEDGQPFIPPLSEG